MKKTSLFAITLLLAILPALAQRSERLLDNGWKFTRTDSAAHSQRNFDDSRWSTVSVPHDWAIYGPFSWENDMQKVAITQDGQKEAMEHAGRTGGLPFVGTGWYRLTTEFPEFEEGKVATLMFDGAMSHARVWVNGHEAGYWPYGYNAFNIDITPWLKPCEKNTIAVRLENLPESSRWYPGAGLYRDVKLRVTDKANIPVWGTYITTPSVSKESAVVDLRTKVELPDKSNLASWTISTVITDAEGKTVASVNTPLTDLALYPQGMEQRVAVKNPQLWSPESPALYTATTSLTHNGKTVDESSQRFGIRTIEVVPNKGFYLNGERIKFKGVCMHHDLGPLGAAVNASAIRRQLRILKDMGVNAIRTSHNMPAQALVEACDEAGIMLMPESFDEWNRAKCANGYNTLFDEWVEKDLVNLVHHFRNNPSVVMWCIGNEVPNQGYEGDSKIALQLQNIVHREDPTRPVTQGMDNPDAVVDNNFAAVMDIPGFNYRPFRYRRNYSKLPQGVILGSETASTVSSRGVYKFPVERKAMAKYDDHQSSGYDVEHCSWSNLPEDDFIQHDDLEYCMGEFVWTGFDYLGEPTPYYTEWPSHSSLFGIVDLAGIPKDRFYLYRSHWNKDAETLHILPHWTWPGREGEVTPVFVYTNYPEAELFINGKSQGRRKKDLSIGIDSTYTPEARQNLVRQQRYRLMWMDTRYEPGTVKVVAYDEAGNKAAETEIHTAGKPYRIVLTPEQGDIAADGKDLAFINVKIVDKDGNLCPDASSKISFRVSGAGNFRAVANGDPSSLELFHEPAMSAFHGQLTAIVCPSATPGRIIVEAKAKGLKSGRLEITTVPSATGFEKK